LATIYKVGDRSHDFVIACSVVTYGLDQVEKRRFVVYFHGDFLLRKAHDLKLLTNEEGRRMLRIDTFAGGNNSRFISTSLSSMGNL
jgi:hypothetical protein